MADLTTQLVGGEGIGLQFIIVPSGQTYTTPATKTGILVFREEDNTIEVNGHLYHCDDTNTDHANDFTNLAAALTSLKDAGLMTELNGIYTKTTPITTTETGISLGEGVTTGTIAQFLTALETEISGLNTIIGNLDATVYGAGSNGTSATTDATSATTSFTGDTTNKVVVKVTEVDGKITGVDVKTNDIASASDLTTLDNAAVKSVNGATGNSVTLTGANINVGGTGTHKDNKIDAAIEDIYSSIGTTVSGGQLHLYSGETGTATATAVTADGSTYRLVQGTTEVARFNIEKDSFVKEGTLVYGPEDDGDGGPGLASGNTQAIDEVASPDTANNKTTPYLKLVIKSTDGGEYYVYIKASDLVEIYTGTVDSNDTGVTISVDSATKAISASLHIKNGTDGDTVSGTADAANGVTKASYVQVANSVSVTTTNGTVTDATVGAGVSADAAGAANAAYKDALGTTNDASGANTIYGANKAAAAAASEAAKHTTVTGSTGTAADKGYIVITDTRANNTDAHAYTVDTTTALDTAINTAESNAKNYADTICSWTVIGGDTGATGATGA